MIHRFGLTAGHLVKSYGVMTTVALFRGDRGMGSGPRGRIGMTTSTGPDDRTMVYPTHLAKTGLVMAIVTGIGGIYMSYWLG